MKSATSFFNAALFRDQLRRALPLLLAEALLWVLLLPSSLSGLLSGDTPCWLYEQQILGSALKGGLYMAAVFGLFYAMLSFSYLFSTRATSCYHALPLRRETLFATLYLAGLFCQLIALLPAFAATAYPFLPSGPYAFPHWDVLGKALGGAAMEIVFFYSFAVFCVMFTGVSLAAPVFFLVGNVLVSGVETMLRTFAGQFLYGYVYDGLSLGPFSPFFFLCRRLQVFCAYKSGTDTVSGCELRGFSYLYIYAAIGLVLAVLSLLLYRRRKSELSGAVIAFPWAVPVFQYGVAFCAALVLGQLSYYLFFGQHLSNGRYSLSGTIMCMLVSGLLGYYIAEALVKKSLRVLRSGARGACIIAGVLVLLGVTMTYDLTGYENRVPDVNDIAEAYVDFGGSTWFTAGDSATLSLVTDAHRAVIHSKDDPRQHWESGTTLPDRYRRYTLTLSYALKNGASFRREYSLVLDRDELLEASSLTARLNALYTCPTAVQARALHIKSDALLPDNPNQNFTNTGYFIHDTYSPEGDRSLTYTLTARQAEAVCRAAMEDCARPEIAQDIFSAQEGTATSDGSSVIEYRYVELYANVVTFREDSSSSRSVESIHFEVTPEMTATLAALAEIERTSEPDEVHGGYDAGGTLP